MQNTKIILSTANQQIKNIRKLREKKERDDSGLFFVEGLRHVIEAVQQKVEIEEIIYCPDLLNSKAGNQIIKTALLNDINLIDVNEMVFRSLSSKNGPQGLAAVIHQKWDSMDSVSEDDTGIWIALDEIQDPGNLGSILRTMDAVGGKGVILLDHTTDAYHPTTVRASMGAIFSQKIIRMEKIKFIDWLRKHKIQIIGTTCDDGKDYQEVKYPSKLILVLGSEQKGLPDEIKGSCTQMIHVPMIGRVDSLNLANAASIILYEIFNQHRADIII